MLNDGSLYITSYFTGHKIIHIDLRNLHFVLVCHCDVMKAWIEYQK